MSSVDERVVRMRFDNVQFKKAAGETSGILDRVKNSVNSAGKSRGLMDMAKHMETVSVKASAMQVAVATAIANIANRAVNAGINMAKSLTLDPVKAGFDEYELKMKSIQTILANTKGENLKSVSSTLNELNDYADYTIYNFGQMTNAIGQLTTSGMGLKESASLVKGFHNMVALAGGSATEAAEAMVQMSQGIQAGVLKAQDWMSIEKRGLGSQSLQKALFATAESMGTITNLKPGQTFEEWIKASGGFKGSLEQGWMTADVFSQTMQVMTGDLKTVQDIMKLGYSKKAAKDLLEMSENALESATKVRTLTAFWETMQEQLGSGWSQIMETLFGDFNEATELFTGLSDKTGQWIGTFFGYISTMLKGWDEMGGRAAIIQTIQNLLAPLGAIINVVMTAWNKAFPAKRSGDGLVTMSKGLEALTSPLQLVATVIGWLTGPLTGLFKLFGLLGATIGTVTDFISPFLDKFVDFVNNINVDISGGGVIQFFKDLAKALGDAIAQVKTFVDKGGTLRDAIKNISVDLPSISDLFGGGKKDDIKGFIDSDISGKVSAMGAYAESKARGLTFNPDAEISSDRVRDISDSNYGEPFEDIGAKAESGAEKLEKAGDKIEGFWVKIKDFFGGMVERIKGLTMEDVVSSLNLAVLTAMMISFSRALNAFSDGMGIFGGLGDGVGGLLGDLASGFSDMGKAMARQALAKMLIGVGVAFALLAVSLWLLSKIPADKLAGALIAIMGIAMVIKYTMDALTDAVEKMEGKGVNAKMLVLSVLLVAFGISLMLLAGAVKMLNGTDLTAFAMVAAGMFLMIKAMEGLAKIDNKGLMKTGFALIIVGAALLLFAGAIKLFSLLDLATFAEGMTYVAVALGVLTKILMGFQMGLRGAIGIFIVVAALTALVGVIKLFALLDWGTFAKGMIMTAISLGIMVFALHGFQTSLAGAAAMLVVAGAMLVFIGVIKTFSLLDWGAFGKGLAMLTISIVTIGLLMALLGAFAPVVLLGALAIVAFGAALALLGIGIVLIAKGLALLILLGAGAAAAMSAFAVGAAVAIGAFVTALAAELPIIKNALISMLGTLIDFLVEAVPLIIDGIRRLWNAVKAEFTKPDKKGFMGDQGKSWVDKIKDAVQKKIPEIVEKAKDLALKFIKGVTSKAAMLGAEAAKFVAKFIGGIASNIGGVIQQGANLIIAFINGISSQAARIADAAAKAVINFINALANSIRENGPAMGDAMSNLGIAMVQGLIGGVTSMMDNALSAISGLAQGMVDKAKGILKIFSPSRVFKSIGKFLVQGLTEGIQKNANSAIRAVANMVQGQIAIANEYISKYIQKLDQQAIKAQAKAEGLARAAERAAKSAEKTKSEEDDKAAEALQKKADAAAAKAEKAEAKAQAAKDKQDRRAEFKAADSFRKAEMRAEDAQTEIDLAKTAEKNAAAYIAEANALEKQAKAKGVTEAEKKKLLAAAKTAREKAKKEAKAANTHLATARKHAAESLTWQKRAGEEAAAAFQKQYEDEAKAAEEQKKYEAMSDAGKAAYRRKQAAELQAKADKDLARAKKLAFTDLEAANELASVAMAGAQQARDYLEEADRLTNSNGTSSSVDSSAYSGPVKSAAESFARSEGYLTNAEAASAARTVYNQYNYSPESLSTAEIYRLTQNQMSRSS